MAKVTLEFDGPIARLTLNRPDVLNAMDGEMADELLRAIKKIEQHPAARCVIFSGAGKSFMAGADVGMLAAQLADPDCDLRHELESNASRWGSETAQAMERLNIPVIASVRGAVAGAGIGFACSADFVIASDTAMFVAAHAMVGLSPDGGASWYLHRLVGAARAKQIMMLGQRIDAQEALRIGMVMQVVPDAELEAATEALAKKLLAMPAKSLANIKLLVNRAPQQSFADHLQMEAQLLGEAALTPDFREGVTAFLEKRRPQFNQA